MESCTLRVHSCILEARKDHLSQGGEIHFVQNESDDSFLIPQHVSWEDITWTRKSTWNLLALTLLYFSMLITAPSNCYTFKLCLLIGKGK